MYILPFLLTTAHPSHILFTDDLTFIPLASAGVACMVEGATGWRCACGTVTARMRASSGLLEASSARSIANDV